MSLGQQPQIKKFGRRSTKLTAVARIPDASIEAARLPRQTSNVLKEVSLAIIVVALIGIGFTLHAASLDDALATLEAMSMIEVFAVMAGLFVPWVLARALAGLPFPDIGQKASPPTESLPDDFDFAVPLADIGTDEDAKHPSH